MSFSIHAAWRIDSRELLLQTSPDCQQQFFPVGLGHGETRFFALDSGLSFIETRVRPNRDLAIINQNHFDEPRMVVTIGLKGNSRFVDSHSEVVFRESHTVITTVGSTTGERQYESDQEVFQLRFSFPKSWLDKHIGMQPAKTLFADQGTRLIASTPTRPQSLISVRQLTQCTLQGEMAKLYRLGSSMSILASELGCFYDQPFLLGVGLNEQDRLIAERAREILCQEYRYPPSVEVLAKRVYTNSFKLKKLFHQYFNNTPYGMTLDIRMHKAYQLLLDTQLKITDIGTEVGYQHAGNFTSAFTKYFGMSPKQIPRHAQVAMGNRRVSPNDRSEKVALYGRTHGKS